MTKMCRYDSSVNPTRSERQLRRVMTFGGSVHFAPLGGVGMLIRQLSFTGTFIVNAIVLPSGDHSSPDGASVRCEICVVAPSASIYRTKICEPLGSPFPIYAMRLPSGDHCTSDPWTSARGCEPSAFIIQIDVSHLSFILSTQRRPKMILVPSLGRQDERQVGDVDLDDERRRLAAARARPRIGCAMVARRQAHRVYREGRAERLADLRAVYGCRRRDDTDLASYRGAVGARVVARR